MQDGGSKGRDAARLDEQPTTTEANTAIKGCDAARP